MDWNAVADGLCAAARTTGLNALEHVPDALPSVAFYVGEIDVEFDVTFRRRGGAANRRGTDQGMVTCRVLVAKSDDKHALRKLRTYMSGSGPTSLVQALSEDKTLGGVCDSSAVKTARGNRLFDVGGAKYYGVEIEVFVIGSAQ